MKTFLYTLCLCLSISVVGQETIVVTDCNLQGWVKQPTAGTSLGFKSGLASMGKGSLEFSSPNINFVRFRSTSYHNTLLSSITSWGYSTYVKQRTNNKDVHYVVVLIDKNNDGRTDDNLVFDPRFQSAPYIKNGMPDQGLSKVGEWQQWDMLRGGWWVGPPPRPDPDQGGDFFTLQSYIDKNPGARIINDAALGGGGIRLTAGAVVGIFAPGFIGSADAFRIGVNGVPKTFDFEFTIADAGMDKLVNLGYGSNCVGLTGTREGGVAPYTYSWTGPKLASSSAAVTVCPDVTSTYVLTVTDSKGCKGADEATVQVVDLRCGSKLDKVKICHKGQELCVANEAVKAHLAHGDVLGSCDIAEASSFRSIHADVKGVKLSGYPNPFRGSVNIAYTVPSDGSVSLQVFDLNGQKVANLVNGKSRKGNYDVRFSPRGSSSGNYLFILRVESGGEVFTETKRMYRLY